MFKRKPKVLTPEQVEEIRTKDFFDMILPGSIKFLSDHYIVGDSYRCVWAIDIICPVATTNSLFFNTKDFHDLTVNLRYFAGDFHAHHALSVLRGPEVVVELDRGFRDSFHCLSFPLARSSGWTSLKKSRMTVSCDPMPIKQSANTLLMRH